LRFVIKRQVIAVPFRNGRVRLHSVVLLALMAGPHIYFRRRFGKGFRSIASAATRAATPGRGLGWRLRPFLAQFRCRRFDIVGDVHQGGGCSCLLGGFRNHHSDRLTDKQNVGALENVELLARLWVNRRALLQRLVRQVLGVQMGDDG
jgi:hypothetical protein